MKCEYLGENPVFNADNGSNNMIVDIQECDTHEQTNKVTPSIANQINQKNTRIEKNDKRSILLVLHIFLKNLTTVVCFMYIVFRFSVLPDATKTA